MVADIRWLAALGGCATWGLLRAACRRRGLNRDLISPCTP